MIESETAACGRSRVPDPELVIRFRPQAGDRLPLGSGNRRSLSGNVHRKVLMNRSWCQQTTKKNEPVVGRNNLHRARPCKKATLTPWIWTGRTKEVRTRWETGGDPGRHGRCAAIEGRGYTKAMQSKMNDVLFRVPRTTLFSYQIL